MKHDKETYGSATECYYIVEKKVRDILDGYGYEKSRTYYSDHQEAIEMRKNKLSIGYSHIDAVSSIFGDSPFDD